MAEIQENPFLAFFSNFLRGIHASFPPKSNAKIDIASDAYPVRIKPADTQDEIPNPDFVNFPRRGFASLKLESEAMEAEPNTNPVLLWQVYAIGGFFILRWAWTRWNEHKGRKRLNDTSPPDGEDHHRP